MAEHRDHAHQPALPASMIEAAYAQLRDIAGAYLAGRRGTVLQATSLVHEAFVRLARKGDHVWNDEAHFAATVAKVMRRVLVDEVRSRLTQRRGGGRAHIDLEVATVGIDAPVLELLALDEALEALARLSERQARIIELRYFGGLSIPETAVALDVSDSTVEKEWTIARAWLKQRLGDHA